MHKGQDYTDLTLGTFEGWGVYMRVLHGKDFVPYVLDLGASPRPTLGRPLRRRADAINASKLKRALDVFMAVSLLTFFAPAMICIAIGIALEGPGPIIFRQERYGLGKSVFMLLKFRTMRVSETSGPMVQASLGDGRITTIGRFLRRTSLDELPQLWNVLRGDMSLVGPRPHAIVMDEAFGRFLPYYSDRHFVRPGLTGLAQVEGYRGPTDTDQAISQRLRRDRIYIRRWSLRLDFWILARTPFRMMHPNAL